MLNKIEKFFLNTLKNQQEFNTPEDDNEEYI
jgi:hypothetical protein